MTQIETMNPPITMTLTTNAPYLVLLKLQFLPANWGEALQSWPRAMSVAVIGSSGGGTATLGHTEAAELLRTIHEELRKVEDAVGTDDETPC